MPARVVLAMTSGFVLCGLQVGRLPPLAVPANSHCYWKAAPGIFCLLGPTAALTNGSVCLSAYHTLHTKPRLLWLNSVLTHGFNIVHALVHSNNFVLCVELCVAKIQDFQQVGLSDDHVFRPEIQVQDVVCVEVLRGTEDLPQVVSNLHF